MSHKPGYDVIHALEELQSPATMTEVVTHIAEQLDIPAKDIRETVKKYLENGVKLGLFRRVRARYILEDVDANESTTGDLKQTRGKPAQKRRAPVSRFGNIDSLDCVAMPKRPRLAVTKAAAATRPKMIVYGKATKAPAVKTTPVAPPRALYPKAVHPRALNLKTLKRKGYSMTVRLAIPRKGGKGKAPVQKRRGTKAAKNAAKNARNIKARSKVVKPRTVRARTK